MITFDKPWHIHRDISQDRIDRVIKAAKSGNNEDVVAAMAMGIWDQIKDCFSGGAKKEALQHLFNFVKANTAYRDHDASESIKLDAYTKAMAAFDALKGLASDGYKECFSDEIRVTNGTQTKLVNIGGRNENNNLAIESFYFYDPPSDESVQIGGATVDQSSSNLSTAAALPEVVGDLINATKPITDKIKNRNIPEDPQHIKALLTPDDSSASNFTLSHSRSDLSDSE